MAGPTPHPLSQILTRILSLSTDKITSFEMFWTGLDACLNCLQISKKLFCESMGILKIKLRSLSLSQLLLINPVLLIMHTIRYIINAQYKYDISNKCDNEVNLGSNWVCSYCLFENKCVKRCVQSHVSAHSPPCLRPNKKCL